MRIFAADEHDKAIETHRDAAMRRRAESKRAQQMAEQFLLIFITDAEHAEHFLLQIRFVDSNAAAADLHTV